MPIVTRTYRMRIHQTADQEQAFWRIVGCCRLVFNRVQEHALRLHQAGVPVTPKVLRELRDKIPGWKAEMSFLKAVPSHCLQEAIGDLGRGWQNFAEGRTKKPRFRRKFGRTPGFRFPDPAQFRIEDRAGKTVLICPKFGRMDGDAGALVITCHRPIKGRMKTCTIARDGEHWVACIVCEIPVRERRRCGNAAMPVLPSQAQMTDIEVARRKASKTGKPARVRKPKARRKPCPDPFMPRPLTPRQLAALARLRVTGVDRNITHPVVTDDGRVFGEEILTPKALRKLAKLQADVSRKLDALRAAHGLAPGASLRGIPRGYRLRRAQQKVVRFWSKLARRREDLLHRIANALLDGADVVVLEDLDLKAMTATDKPDAQSRRTRAFLDKSPGRLREILTYKAAWRRKLTIRVDPAYTSQRCHACKHVAEDNRDRHRFRCRACGHADHADVNASRNIREAGIAGLRELLGLPPDIAIGRMPVHTAGRNAGRLNAPGRPDICPA